MGFSDELLHWYQANKRALPWRNTNNAYIIWLSEIILQQTRVEQGMPYFYRFLEKYPTVASFAAADEDDILKLWQGLGYYSRGRNMLKTARMVNNIHNGEFPVKYEELIMLKGIGEYTASAISSFAANEARAVVDGNVYRVLARYFGISEPINSTTGKKIFQQIANDALNRGQPGLHNQAMMEFGAMLCKPKNPLCSICPVRPGCYAYNKNLIAALPVKLKKLTVKERHLNYFFICDGQTILMNKRGDGDIWANMYDLPMIESGKALSLNEIELLPAFTELFAGTYIKEALPVKRHVLTHQHLYLQFVILTGRPAKLQPSWFYTTVENLPKLALPKGIFIFLKNIFNL